MGSDVILLVRLLPSPTPSIHPAFKKRLSTIDWSTTAGMKLQLNCPLLHWEMSKQFIPDQATMANGMWWIGEFFISYFPITIRLMSRTTTLDIQSIPSRSDEDTQEAKWVVHHAITLLQCWSLNTINVFDSIWRVLLTEKVCNNFIAKIKKCFNYHFIQPNKYRITVKGILTQLSYNK